MSVILTFFCLARNVYLSMTYLNLKIKINSINNKLLNIKNYGT